MKNLFTILFVFVLLSARATNYYFSSVTGDDSRTAAQAKSPSTPWKTLSKLNSFFSSLQSGDAVLLKRGETFFGSIIITKSGTSASPMVIGAYGSGSKPVITSLVTLGGWVSKGNGIWESSSAVLGATVNNVLINNISQQMGRYPNKDAANKGYLTLESHTSHSITDNQLSASPNWTGAEVVIRVRRWVMDRCKITSHSGHTINYVKASNYSANDNFGYFIQNDIKTLDQFGEWYYNKSTKKVSIFFGTKTPSSYAIQAGAVENLVSASNRSNIIFDNLNITGANADGFNIPHSSNISIQNCDVAFSGGSGVTATFNDHLKIENCTIANSDNNGIDLGYSGGDYATIRNNKITNTSVFAGMGGSGDGKGFGIQSSGSHALIEYNEVVNTGYVSINFNGDYTIVKNNFIDGFCLTKDDGSGIYTFTGSANANRIGRKVIGNIVINGIGVPEGVNDKVYLAEGIYLDDNASGVEISGNTVANVPSKGIFLHNTRNIIVSNNTLFNNKVHISFLHNSKGDPIRKCTITHNIMFLKSVAEKSIAFLSSADDANLIGKIDSNYYARPSSKDSNSFLKKVHIYEPKGKVVNYNSTVNFEFNSLLTNKTIALTSLYKDVKNNSYSNSTVLTQFTSLVLIAVSGGNTSGLPTVSLTSPAQNASYNSGANVTIAADASVVGGSIKKVEFYNGTTLLHTESTSPYNWNWSNVPAGSYTITAKATDNNGKTATSSSVTVSVSVSGEESPTVSVTSPSQNASYNPGATINISANANADYGSISKVEFYNGTTLLHTETKSPFSWDWKNVQAGNYTITAKAIDSDGNATTSASVAISVTADGSPVVSLTSPEQDDSYNSGTKIIVTAAASVAKGWINKVEFYDGSTLIHTETGKPYTWNWKNVTAGTHTLTAKAIDNKGNATTSASVTISVVANIANRSISNNNMVTINNASNVTSIDPATASKLKNQTQQENIKYSMKLFPNPAVNKIQINIDGLTNSNQKANLTIQNLSGVMLKNIPVILSGNTIEADVSSLQTGVYIVNIVSGNFIINKKFIKN